MKPRMYSVIGSLAGLGIVTTAAAAQANPPGVYYSWRAIDTSVAQCVDRAGNALESLGLEQISGDETSIAGRLEDVTAVFICMEQPDSTTVMVIVSGEDETQAVTLREGLKAAF